MILSIIKPFNRNILMPAAVALALMLTCFKTDRYRSTAEALNWSNNCLSRCYDPSGEGKLKRWELNVTANLFVRFRKTYQGGRQDYYSFRIKNLADLVYLGTSTRGLLQLKTETDNIIEQTYNDPKGDVDNMVQQISIPVKNMEPEQLDSLRAALLFLKSGAK